MSGALLTRDLPEKNEEVWAAGMNAIRAMLDDLRRHDFKDIGNAYPAAIWAAMHDAALSAGGEPTFEHSGAKS